MKRYLPYLLLLSLVFIGHVNSLKNEFLNWDDNAYVVNNPYIKDFSLENIKHLVFDFYVGEWFPLQMISYLIDYKLWHLNPAGYHITNLIFHFASVILIYLIFIQIGYTKSESLIAASLFSIFPPSVEAIAWISQRKSVMNMFFMLLSLLLYFRAFEGDKLKTRYYILSVFSHFFSLLCKSTSIPAPGLIIFYEIIMRSGLSLSSFKSGLKRAVPHLIISLLILIVFIYGQHHGGVARNYNLKVIWQSFVILLVSPFYWFTSKIFLPVGLNAFYPPLSYDTIETEQILVSGFLWITLIPPLVLFSYKSPLKIMWISFYFVAVIPGSVFAAIVLPSTPTETSSGGGDRHLYYLGLVTIGFLCAGMEKIIKSSRFVNLVILLFISAYLLLTIQRNTVWMDDVSLWSDSVKKSPYYFFNQFKAGASYLDRYQRMHLQSDIEMAIYHLQKAVELNPEIASFHFKLGFSYELKKDYEKAREEYLKSAELDRGSPYSHQAMGRIYYFTGEIDRAIAEYKIATDLYPDYFLFWAEKGIIEMESGFYDDAIYSFEKSLKLNYNQYDIHRRLGAIYLKEKKDTINALLHFEESFRINPSQPDVEILLRIINELKSRVDK